MSGRRESEAHDAASGRLPASIHATAAAVGETGFLILGASGAGKSALARALIAEGLSRGWFARLVGDDRILLSNMGGHLLARPHRAIAGLMERRGTGIVPVVHEPACVLHWAIELVPCGDLPRMPGELPIFSSFGGIQLAKLQLPAERAIRDLALDVVETCLATRRG